MKKNFFIRKIAVGNPAKLKGITRSFDLYLHKRTLNLSLMKEVRRSSSVHAWTSQGPIERLFAFTERGTFVINSGYGCLKR